MSSLNSYGYSPYPLQQYVEWTYRLLTEPTGDGTPPSKPVIISITESSPARLSEMLRQIGSLRERLSAFHHARAGAESICDPSALVAVELNTSCPNIPNSPPPSYDPSTLAPLVAALATSFHSDPMLTMGLKLPPYLYSAQYKEVVEVIGNHSCDLAVHTSYQKRINPIAYLACTNTLGSSMLFSGQTKSPNPKSSLIALPTTFGGLAGEAIHPLALGNVCAFRQLLVNHPDLGLQQIKIIGIGGVTSAEAVSRMQQAGAHVVGCASLVGQYGVKAFELLTAE